jgi:Flp pilus assembly protein TadD
MRSSIASGPLCPAAVRPLPGLLAGTLVAVLLAVLLPPAPAFGQAGPPPAARLPEPGGPATAMSDPRSADTAVEQARRLADEGRPDDALAAIERALQSSPADARLRFLKGVILGNQGRSDEAIAVFQALAQQFPELPEPHNNLAALHAERGELDQARQALDEAVRALPSYALAHENLGDLHLRLAIRSWQRAARLEPRDPSPATKLKLASELARQITPETPAQLPGTR